MTAVVVGRDRELASAGEFLATASEGPAALVLEGDAGIGKTTVWREVVRQAEATGFEVLSCRPAQQEAKLSLSAVADLLEATPAAVFEALPTPQRHALEIALLRREPRDAPSDARSLGTAVRSIFTSLAHERPLLVAIDDVQWLDRASAAALGFAFRRRGATRCGWLFARRRGMRAAPALEDILVSEDRARIDIEPLTLGALHHVIGTRLGQPLPRPLLRRVHEVSGGNPFFALEIARLLPAAGELTPDVPLPVPRDVAELVRRRVAAMPQSTREMLLVAAAAATPSRTLVERVLEAPLADCFDPAERAGFAALEDDTVVFLHPLYAAAIYEAGSAGERRTVHRRLADAIEESEEHARHVALSVETGDDTAAATVQIAARTAFLRGLPSAAAELAELALRVAATRGPLNAERIVDRAYYLYCAGEPAQARDVLLEVGDWAGWPAFLEARARGLLLELVFVNDGETAAVDLGERMLTEPLPREARARVLVHLSNAYFDAERALARGDEALRLLAELGDLADAATWARALCWRVRNRLGLGFGIDRTDVDRALAFEARLPRERWLGERISYRFGIWVRYVDELDESRRLLEHSLEEARETTDELLELTLLVHLGLTECYAGNLLLAREHIEQASNLGSELDIRPAGLLAARAVVEAHRGEEMAVRALVGELLSDDATERSGPAAIQANLALGLLELSLGNARAADTSLTAALSGIELAGQREPGVFRVHGHAAEAALASGDPERALQTATFLIEHGERIGHGWSLAVGTRVSALVAASRGNLDEALERAEQSRRLHDALPMPFERALALLALGTIERRSRLRTRAKASLEGAIDLFDAVGAGTWSAHARAELDRVGLRRQTSATGELTPSEARVAERAAQGLTTREIASELFVAQKTVEANLTRIYRKLGVRSRAALAARMREGGAGQEPAKL